MENHFSEPEQVLRKISFDLDVSHVLRTPNRIHFRPSQFQGWEDLKEHPLQSPDRKTVFTSQKTRFKVKPIKMKINPQSVRRDQSIPIQNKQNYSKEKLFNQKMVKLLDQQILSPSSRKILTPNKQKTQRSLQSSQRFYRTPQQTNKNKEPSLKKLSLTETCNKIYFSEKREKQCYDETMASECFLNQENADLKITLNAIVYPVLKTGNKMSHRRIDRFHSFVARTVRK